MKSIITQINDITKIKRKPIKIKIAAGFKEHIKDSIFEAWPIIVFDGVDSDG